MVECAKCGKKIGFFGAKYGYEDDKGNPITYCSACNKEYLDKENEERLAEIKPFLKKYFLKCDVHKRFAIKRLFSEKEVFNKFSDDSLEQAREHFVDLYTNINAMIDNGTYDDLDGAMMVKKLCERTFSFLDDLEKTYRLFEKKNIETNYPELIEQFHNILQESLDEENDKILKREYKRISNKVKKKTVRNVVKEFINSPFKSEEVDVESCKQILDRFKLDYEENELAALVDELIEEVDLEDFEENLGEKKNKNSLPDYHSLNGHQFESFLKDLFQALGYTVNQTKLSGDQGADLILLKDREKTVVQAKKYTGSVSNRAVQEVVASCKHYKCDNSMVVTTGKFTKSAVQLAMSNDVELWDYKKLDKVIDDLNNSSDDVVRSSQESTLENEGATVSCLYCESSIIIAVDDFPEMGEEATTNCSECGVELNMRIPHEYYVCVGCGEEFDTVRQRMVHAKKCSEMEKRKKTCKGCKEDFFLDDGELEELTKKGVLTIKCPACGKESYLNR